MYLSNAAFALSVALAAPVVLVVVLGVEPPPVLAGLIVSFFCASSNLRKSPADAFAACPTLPKDKLM